MTAPTDNELRAALLARLNRPGDDYARNGDWIGYLSDGLIRYYRDNEYDGSRLPPALDAMVDAALPTIAAQCHELAITRLVALAKTYAELERDTPEAVGSL